MESPPPPMIERHPLQIWSGQVNRVKPIPRVPATGFPPGFRENFKSRFPTAAARINTMHTAAVSPVKETAFNLEG